MHSVSAALRLQQQHPQRSHGNTQHPDPRMDKENVLHKHGAITPRPGKGRK